MSARPVCSQRQPVANPVHLPPHELEVRRRRDTLGRGERIRGVQQTLRNLVPKRQETIRARGRGVRPDDPSFGTPPPSPVPLPPPWYPLPPRRTTPPRPAPTAPPLETATLSLARRCTDTCCAPPSGSRRFAPRAETRNARVRLGTDPSGGAPRERGPNRTRTDADEAPDATPRETRDRRERFETTTASFPSRTRRTRLTRLTSPRLTRRRRPSPIGERRRRSLSRAAPPDDPVEMRLIVHTRVLAGHERRLPSFDDSSRSRGWS